MKKVSIILVMALALLVSCGKDSNGTIEPPLMPKLVAPALSAALEPAPNSVCQGVETSDSEVTITIKSAAVAEATSYIYKVFSNDGALFATKEETIPETTISLLKSNAYSYTVTTKNDGGETEGNPISFTTPGVSEANYVPVVTAINFEVDADTVTLLFFDNDGDPLTYTAYLADNPEFNGAVELASDVAALSNEEQLIPNVGLLTPTVLWLRVVLEDSHGNKSVTRRSYKD